jgi:kanamycin nucleotidyltransferase
MWDGMQHEERFQLAQGLCARMTSKYRGGILLAGVYGSTAAGTDTPWSDLEMMFVVCDGVEVPRRRFLYRGIAAGYRVIQRRRLEALLTRPSLDVGFRWPFWMGLLAALEVLYGDCRLVSAWLEMGRSAPVERFRETLEANLSWLVVEPFGRVLSCCGRGASQEIGGAVLELLANLGLSLCLLNQRWTTHGGYRGLTETFEFPRLPEGYQELAWDLWRVGDENEAEALVQTLRDNYWKLLQQEGVEPTNYQTVDELPL